MKLKPTSGTGLVMTGVQLKEPTFALFWYRADRGE